MERLWRRRTRRAAIPLVPKQVAAYAPRAYKYDIPDAVCPGLNLRISPNGSKAWRYFYRDAAGTLRRMTLGHWPAMTLKDAREEGFEQRRALECDGVEPLEAKRASREDAQTNAQSTVLVLWEHYAEIEGRRLRSWNERQRQFEHDIQTPLGDRPVSSLTRGELRAWLDAKSRTAPVRANANYRTMRRFLQFCVERDLLNANPLAGVKKPTQESSRDRVLSAAELGATWRLLTRDPSDRDEPLDVLPQTIDALRVLMATGQRLGAVARMPRSDLTLEPAAAGSWRIPSEDAKNAEPHVVPLNDLALAVVERLAEKRLDARFVFALPPAVKPKVALELRRRTLNPFWRVAAAAGVLRKALGFDFRLHDWRRSCATHLAQHGERPEVIAAVPGHRSVLRGNVTTRHYALYTYDKEKRAALEKWGTLLRRYAAATPSPTAPPGAGVTP
jgi:integrase